jgi:hypothetical protein
MAITTPSTTAPATAKPVVKRRQRKAKSDLQGRFEGLVKLVNEQKLINQMANKLQVNASKAKAKLYAIITRVGRSEGLVSKRSQGDVELVLTTVLELKPSVAEFVEELKSNITYRSNKTGKRDSSWIRDLLAGVPRLENGTFRAYIEISEAKAQEICDGMGIELPSEDVEGDGAAE